MPMYEFQCHTCGHVFERVQKFDDPAPPCPKIMREDLTAPTVCGSPSKKLISRTSFILNGSGWASDNYGG